MSDLLNSASLVMIPSGYKEDVVYSQIPTDGSGDLSFTRASNGTRINSAGLVEDVPWNLADDSNDFGGLALITKTTGQVSPIDSTSGNLLTATGSGEHYSGTASLTVVVGNSYTYSVYGKFVQGINLALRTVFANGDQDIATIWNLSTGALVANAGAHTNPTITAVGNGYYRCSITFIPTVVPAFPLLFRLQMALNGATSFTASSGDGFLAYGAQINTGALAPYFPTTDRLNVPRLTYQNGGGGCPSLLLEKQSTNLVTYSEQFDNGAWSKSGVTVTANDTTSPDGTQNADKVVENTANSSHGCYQGATVTNGIPYTWSGFIKAGERTKVRLYAESSSAPYVSFNLSDGTITNTSGSITGSIENFGNGWYRCIATTTTTGTTAYFNINALDASGNISYTGDGTSGFYIWGAQIEASSYPTSYIPTTSASATRVADECSKTGISSLIGQTEGTLFADIELNLAGSNVGFYALQVYDSASSPTYTKAAYIELYQGKVYGYVRNTTVQCEIISSTYADNTRLKIAIAYKANDFALYVNGVQIGTDTSGSLPSVLNSLALHYSASSQQGSPLHQAIIFPTRLTNAELASLTTI
jgi:hypothetical protein